MKCLLLFVTFAPIIFVGFAFVFGLSIRAIGLGKIESLLGIRGVTREINHLSNGGSIL